MAELTLAPRTRLVVVLALAFAIASITELAVLPFVAGLAGAVTLASGHGGDVLRRLRGPAILALSLVLVLPLMSGQTVLAQLGPVAFKLEGVQAGGLMAVRLLSIVALTLALLAPLSPFQLVSGLRGLGVPALLADIALLTLRYLDEVTAHLRRARLARQLRGGGARWRALPEHALLLATVLIRAQSRADRLWAAMRLRGYSTGLAMPIAPLHPRDWMAMTGAIVVACGVVLLDRTL